MPIRSSRSHALVGALKAVEPNGIDRSFLLADLALD